MFPIDLKCRGQQWLIQTPLQLKFEVYRLREIENALAVVWICTSWIVWNFPHSMFDGMHALLKYGQNRKWNGYKRDHSPAVSAHTQARRIIQFTKKLKDSATDHDLPRSPHRDSNCCMCQCIPTWRQACQGFGRLSRQFGGNFNLYVEIV